MRVLNPQNNESGELEIKNTGYKFQDKNEFILHKNLMNSRGKKITDMIQVFDPPLLG